MPFYLYYIKRFDSITKLCNYSTWYMSLLKIQAYVSEMHDHNYVMNMFSEFYFDMPEFKKSSLVVTKRMNHRLLCHAARWIMYYVDKALAKVFHPTHAENQQTCDKCVQLASAFSTCVV